MNKIKVVNWRYENGNRSWIGITDYCEEIVGWHCQVYDYVGPGPEIVISDWMETNCRGEFDCDYRFNSGDPAYFIHIKDESDAMFFKLTFL